jgi:uncharacterized tellurite resistance protein B-like protein
MLDLIKKAIGLKKTSDPVVIQEEQKVDLLASVFLLEAAHADFECSEKEMDHVVETVKSMYNLPHEYVEELIEFAHSERGQAVDIYPFVRSANEQMSRADKQAILEAVWHIICADGLIDKYEVHFARKLTNLLRLEHKDFIAAKLKAKKSKFR